MKPLHMFACIAALACVAPGCSRRSEPGGSSPEAPAVEYDAGPRLSLIVDGNEVHITPDDATATSSVPLPEDVPVFTGAAVSLATLSPQGEFVEYSVSSPEAEVRKFYVDKLSTGGWQLTSERSSGVTHELSATKSDRGLHVLIDAVEGGTQVTLSHTPAGGDS